MAMTKKQRRNVLRYILIVILVLLLIGTLAVIIIPQYGIWKSEHAQKQVAVSWLQEVKKEVPAETRPNTDPTISEDFQPVSYDELYADLQAYNENLFLNGQSELVDAFSYEVPAFKLSDYGIEDDVFGVVSIPKINVILPMYLGATYKHMADGFAQMSQTSVPIGGPNTNTVLACHRGWNGMAYLRDVEMIDIGDSVYVHNHWGDLEYKVAEIHVVLPSEISILKIQPDRELLTIFTCHPYGVSDHRIVLVCERCEIEESTAAENVDTILDGGPAVNVEYVTELIKGVTITTVNTTDGSEVASSSGMIFLTMYLPWILLGFLFIGFVLLGIRNLIRWIFKRQKKKKSKMDWSVKKS